MFESLDEAEGQVGMGPDDLPDDLSDDEQPRVKIHPPIFKGTPGERARCSYLCSRRLDGSDEGKKG